MTPLAETSPQFGDDRLSAAFWDNVLTHPNGCWLWIGYQSEQGYGKQAPAENRSRRVHVHAYRTLIGDYADGLELDHLCRIRICCNPAHLEPVTHAENMRRAATYRTARAARSAVVKYKPDAPVPCLKGHPASERVWRASGTVCRACDREKSARYIARKRAPVLPQHHDAPQRREPASRSPKGEAGKLSVRG